MAETAPAAPEAAPAKFSRYRSVRRAQTLPPEQSSTPQSPPLPAVSEVPPVPSMPLKKEAPVSRSMSRYHRRPTITQRPPVPVNPGFSLSTQAQDPASAPANSTRARSVSSPQHPPLYTAVQPPLPNISRTRADPATPHAASITRSHTPSQAARDEARQLIESETERQRRMQEQLRAEKRAKLEATQAELERQERLRKEEEEENAEQLRLQREAEEVAQQQREQEEKLKEHGRRLQKAQQAAVQKLREEEARKAALEEYTRRNKPVSPPTSPPRHAGGLHLFGRRRKDDAPSPANSGRPLEASESSNRDLSTIKPGGGGAVLGIDAPKSAINAGDRVSNPPTLVPPGS